MIKVDLDKDWLNKVARSAEDECIEQGIPLPRSSAKPNRKDKKDGEKREQEGNTEDAGGSEAEGSGDSDLAK